MRMHMPLRAQMQIKQPGARARDRRDRSLTSISQLCTCTWVRRPSPETGRFESICSSESEGVPTLTMVATGRTGGRSCLRQADVRACAVFRDVLFVFCGPLACRRLLCAAFSTRGLTLGNDKFYSAVHYRFCDFEFSQTACCRISLHLSAAPTRWLSQYINPQREA